MSRPRIYNTEAIVLRSSPLGEADRLLTLFTPGLGKLRVTARGVRKTTSKLSGHLDPLTRSSLTLTRGQSLDTVTSADSQEVFPSVKGDLGRLSRALYATELVDAFNPLEASSPPTYTLFLEGLRTFDTDADADLVVRYLELHFLGLAGFSSELQMCIECHGQVNRNEHYFSPAAGGILCPMCHQSYPGAMPISIEALKVLRFLSTATMPSAILVRVKPPLQRELAALMDSTLRYTLERELRSTAFMRDVAQPRLHVGTLATAART
ncbi:MAG: DNA repair protein RecO [Dehalococcoidia bacterium]